MGDPVVAAPQPGPRSPYLQRLGVDPGPDCGPLLAAACGTDADPALIRTLTAALDFHGTGPAPGTARTARSTGAAGWPHVPRVRPGRACAVAVLDEGIPVTGLVRAGCLASVWVQDAAARPGGPPWLPFGREAGGAALERLLDLDPVNAALRGLSVVHDAVAGPALRDPRASPGTFGRLRRRATHGAAVLHAAVRGLGPAHPVIAVGFPSATVRDTSGAQLPYHALTGLLHAMAVTRAIGARSDAGGAAVPLVATLSYGVMAGARDGDCPFVRALDAITDPDRADPGLGPVHLVMPMGNGRQAACVARLDADHAAVDLMLLPDDHTPTFVEVRGTTPDRIAVDGCPVTAPDSPVTTLPLTEGATPGLLLVFPATAPGGPPDGRAPDWGAPDWATPGRRRLQRLAGAGPLDLTVQRDDSLHGLGSGGRQAHFADTAYGRRDAAGRVIARDPAPHRPTAITRANTANAFAAGRHVWRTGGGYLRGPAGSVPYSGLGAPGHDRPDEGDIIMACDESACRWGLPVASVTGTAPVRMNGTSLAAPALARRLAQLLAAPGPVPDRATLAALLAKPATPGTGRRILHHA